MRNLTRHRQRSLVGVTDCDVENLSTTDYLEHFERIVADDSGRHAPAYRFLNIGAYDGVTEDPVYSVTQKYQTRGIYIEKDEDMCRQAAANLDAGQTVVCAGVTPMNVLDLVGRGVEAVRSSAPPPRRAGTESGAPQPNATAKLLFVVEDDDEKKNESRSTAPSSKRTGRDVSMHFDLIKIDIDSYDADVLAELLRAGDRITAKHFILEINPGIPPPFKFATGYHPKLFPTMMEPGLKMTGSHDHVGKILDFDGEQVDEIERGVGEDGRHGKNAGNPNQAVSMTARAETSNTTLTSDAEADAPTTHESESFKMHDWPLRGMSLSYAVHTMRQYGYHFLTFGYHDAYFVQEKYRHLYDFKPPYDEFDCYHKAFVMMNGIPIEKTRDWFYRRSLEEGRADIFQFMVRHALENTDGRTAFPFQLSY
eukprot:g6072.t1